MGNYERFVHQVEAQPFAGDPFVTLGEIGPLVNERVERFRIVIDAGLFFGDVDTGQRLVERVQNALARGAVKANIDVDTVLFAQANGAINGLDFLSSMVKRSGAVQKR